MRVSVTFQPLSEADPAGVRDLLVGSVWKRDWSTDIAETYFAWRYRARESGDTLVASDQGRCVGILDSFTRPYWIGGREEIVMSYPETVRAYDPATGKELWRCAGINPLVYTSPIASGETIVAMGGFFGSVIYRVVSCDQRRSWRWNCFAA